MLARASPISLFGGFSRYSRVLGSENLPDGIEKSWVNVYNGAREPPTQEVLNADRKSNH
jgi:hypothetical protein